MTESKTHFALDTDWMTAAFAIIGFALCLLEAVVITRRLLLSPVVTAHVTWDTVFACLSFTWLTIYLRERVLRFGYGLLSLGFASRIILTVFHASALLQAMNGQIMQVVDLVVTAGFCAYIAMWFVHRIKRV